jgi:hypothetical protein
MTKDPRSEGHEITNEHNVPRDPATAGFTGKRRAIIGWAPNPDGNRGERRAAAAAARRTKQRGG